jgi:hypothetical protein
MLSKRWHRQRVDMTLAGPSIDISNIKRATAARQSRANTSIYSILFGCARSSHPTNHSVGITMEPDCLGALIEPSTPVRLYVSNGAIVLAPTATTLSPYC